MNRHKFQTFITPEQRGKIELGLRQVQKGFNCIYNALFLKQNARMQKSFVLSMLFYMPTYFIIMSFCKIIFKVLFLQL